MEARWHQIVSGQDKRPASRLLRAALGMVAWPYGQVVAARNRLFDTGVLRAHRVGAPVISIGNLTLGGTGKTPFVEFVSRWFVARRKRPVILSRGYGRVAGVEFSSPQPIVNDVPKGWGLEDSTPARPDSEAPATLARDHNDEALLLQANLPDVPHLQGKDRVALARRAIEELRPDVLVLDDGFQHRRLARDLDIVLIDCTEPFGYGRLFPRGLLREPISSLRRAGLIVLSRADQCSRADRARMREQIVAAAGEKPIIEAEHRPKEVRSLDGRSLPLGELAGRSVAAFCAIGNPPAFWQTLRGLGCQLVGSRAFRDHHRYSAADLADLAAWAAQLRADFVVTTQKDMVKIPADAWHGPPLVALRIEAAITVPDGHLDRALAKILDDRIPIVHAA